MKKLVSTFVFVVGTIFWSNPSFAVSCIPPDVLARQTDIVAATASLSLKTMIAEVENKCSPETIKLLNQQIDLFSQKLELMTPYTHCSPNNPRVRQDTIETIKSLQSKVADCATKNAEKPPTPASPPPASQTPSNRQSVSCNSSDITGTGDASKSPAAAHCKSANTFAKAAQNTRHEHPVYAADQYRKAAKEAQLAGDIALAEKMLREAQQVDDVRNAPAQHPMSSYVKNPNAEGEHQESLAKRIEQGAYEDQSCDDLEVAADYYDSAMDDFLGSGDFDRAAANLTSEIRVRDLVARLRKEGKCEHKYARNQQSPHSMPPGCSATLNCNGPPPAECKAQIAYLEMLAKQVDMPKDQETAPNGRPMAPRALTAEQTRVKVLRVELAADGCPLQEGEPPLDCGRAAAEWRRNGKDEDYVNAALGAAGCPFKRFK